MLTAAYAAMAYRSIEYSHARKGRPDADRRLCRYRISAYRVFACAQGAAAPLTAGNAYRISAYRVFARYGRAADRRLCRYRTLAYRIFASVAVRKWRPRLPLTAAYAPMLSHIACEYRYDAIENLFGVSAQFVLAQSRDGVRREYDGIAGGAPHCRHRLGCFYEPVGAYGNRGYAGFLCVDSVVHTARAA